MTRMTGYILNGTCKLSTCVSYNCQERHVCVQRAPVSVKPKSSQHLRVICVSGEKNRFLPRQAKIRIQIPIGLSLTAGLCPLYPNVPEGDNSPLLHQFIQRVKYSVQAARVN